MLNDTENANEIETGDVNPTGPIGDIQIDTASPESQTTETGTESKSTPQAESQRGVEQNIPYQRFKEVNDDKKRAIAEAEYWRAQAQKGQSQAPAQQTPSADAEPRPEDYAENPLENIRAQARYDARNEFQKLRQQEAQERERNAKAQQEAERARRIAESDRETAAKYSDFHEVMETSPVMSMPIPDAMRPVLDMFLASKQGSEIKYALAKNPAIAQKILSMNPSDAAIELAVLARPATGNGQTQQTVSKAPKPISPVGGGKSSPPRSYSDDMSQEEYNAAFPPIW